VAEADGDEVKSLVATMADRTSRKLFSTLYNVWMTSDGALLLFSTLYGCSIVSFDCCCLWVILQTLLLLSCVDLSTPYDDGEKGNVDDDAIDDDDEALTSRHVAMMIANVRRSMIVCCG
jgi:hypothetical protein